MRGEGEVRGDLHTVMMVAACALIALFGVEALAQDADDEATWYFGYEEPVCGGAPYLATRNLATIRREEARGALLSSSTVSRGDREHVNAILSGERSVSDAGPCRLVTIKPDPIGDPEGPAADAAAVRAIVRAALEEASAVLATHEADLRAAHAAVGKAHLEAGAVDPDRFSGYADGKCESPVVETTGNMARIAELAVAGEVRSFTGSFGTCMEISPAGG